MEFPIESNGKLFPTFLAAGGYAATWGTLLCTAFAPHPLPSLALPVTSFALAAAIGGGGSAVSKAKRGDALGAAAEGLVTVSAGALGAAVILPTPIPVEAAAVGGMAGLGVSLTAWVQEETGVPIPMPAVGRGVEILANSLVRRLSRIGKIGHGEPPRGKKVRRAAGQPRVVFSSEIPDWLTSGEKKRGAR